MTGKDRLAGLDDRFVAIYEAARRRLLDEQKTRALILVNEDYMLFYHGGSEPRTITGMRPPLYEKLKTASHIPLAIYCLVIGQAESGSVLPPPVLAALRDYRQELAARAHDLDTTAEVDSEVLPHRVDILGRAFAFLDRVLAEKRVSEKSLTEFCRANVADIHACFFAATKVQLDACHAQVMYLKEHVLSADDWASLRVVIMGPHMAHKDQNFLQYFARLLHTPKYADRRVVYFEGDDVEGALDLMGTTMLDLQASRSIFDDESRLHRDVLSDATARYLDELLRG